MDLSDGEKLILVMLGDIYKKLGIKENDSEVDGNFVQTCIFGSQSWALRWKYSGLFNNEGDDPPHVTETADILTMYRALDQSYDKLSASDKKKLEKEADYNFSYIKFQGFDGNNDPHYSVVSFFVEHLDRFDELKGGRQHLNSHTQSTLPKYRKMLAVYKTLGYPRDGYSLDQLLQILRA
jgi:uncharacterized protein YfbU (UPF0304 family)